MNFAACFLSGLDGFPALLVAVAAAVLAIAAVLRLRRCEAKLGELARSLADLPRASKAAPDLASVPPAHEAPPALDAETIVLLTAAVAAYLKAPPRIVAIRYPVAENLTWVHEGREDIMLSHRIR